MGSLSGVTEPIRQFPTRAISRGGARRWPGSPAPGSGSRRTCTSASASRRCCTSPPTSRPLRSRSTRSTEAAAHDRARDRPLRAGVAGERRRGCARLRRRPRSRSAPWSATRPVRSCSCSAPTRGIWLYPTGWADIGYSPSEIAVKEVAEETGIECEPVRLLSVMDGQRLGFTRFGMYMLLFYCRATGGELRAAPARDRRRRLVRRGRTAGGDRRRAVVGPDGVRGDQRRGDTDPLRRAAQPGLARD